MARLQQYEPSMAPTEFGFENTGVICHFNSLLQALLGCPSVISTVMASHKYYLDTATGREFLRLLLQIYDPKTRALRDKYKDTLTRCSASLLRELSKDLRARRPDFKFGGSQESASEGLVLLLDMLEPEPAPEDVKAGRVVSTPLKRLFEYRYEVNMFCTTCKTKIVTNVDTGVQFNMFYLDSKPECKTDMEFSNQIKSYVCDTPTGYRCKKCGVIRGLTHYKLRMVPEIVVLSFNLYGDRRERFIPSQLQFRSDRKTWLTFQIVAQVEHTGTLHGGHYVARGRRKNGIYMFNDSSVSESTFLTRSRDTYLVFYHFWEETAELGETGGENAGENAGETDKTKESAGETDKTGESDKTKETDKTKESAGENAD